MPTVSVRYATIAAVVVGLAALHLPYRPRTFCLFRATTGIPCPFCGGTTAAVHLGKGDLRGAVLASPLAVLLAGTAPLIGVIRAPGWLTANRLLHAGAISAVLIAAEMWELVRLGLIGA